MFWLVFEVDGERFVWIETVGDRLQAAMRASLAGQPGDKIVEGHAIDAKTARKVPAEYLQRRLSAREAEQLLRKLG